MRFLRQNAGLKTLSFVLAMVAWSIVRITGAPTGEIPAQRVFTVPIRITPPEALDLVPESALKDITLTLRGKSSVIDRIRPALIQADVDLSRRKPGNYLEKVNVLAPGGAEVVEVEPSHIGVKISRRRASQVPVVIEVKGQPAEGYQVGEPAVEPGAVKVYGPEDDVAQVVAVRGPVVLAGNKVSESTTVSPLVPVNAQGMVVVSVSVQPSKVAVTVPVEPVAKAHGVQLDDKNVSASASRGWELVGIRIDPPSVTLRGPANLEPPGRVPTEAVTFSGVTATQTRAVRVLAPEGFQVVGSPTVKVTVEARRLGSGEKVSSSGPP